MVTIAMNLKDTCPLKRNLWQTRQRIKEQRNHFANKSPHSQSYGFSSSHMWMWEDRFELWCWRRLSRVPGTTERSNHSILKEINSEYSFKELMLKLKLQYVGHLMWRTDSLEKTLMLGEIEGRRRRGRQRMRWLALPTQWTWVWANSGR